VSTAARARGRAGLEPARGTYPSLENLPLIPKPTPFVGRGRHIALFRFESLPKPRTIARRPQQHGASPLEASPGHAGRHQGLRHVVSDPQRPLLAGRLHAKPQRVRSTIGPIVLGTAMANTSGFMDHWVNIDLERLERYEKMYQWSSASEGFYAPADITEGKVVADFGCGPGHAAIEFAKRVGPSGHVHALDINAEFASRATDRAQQAGLGERITVHLLRDSRLPLPDDSLDRIVARNTIIYVEDPVITYREFHRVLRTGGIAHAIEGDWSLTVVEPVPTALWREVVEAASWAWPRPEMGRKLYGIVRRAGFHNVSLQVVTIPDTEGRLNGMIQSVAQYARESGNIDGGKLDSILETIQRARDDGSYLAISPQFLVTATK